ncbi:MAG: sigma-70 family RNA polymerase sigma factor [Cyanobacteria bacterium P01_F01_bin.150]
MKDLTKADRNRRIVVATLNYFHQWIKRGRKDDDPLRRRIIEENIGLAGKAATKLCRVSPVPKEDLYQVAVIGLDKAVRRFDPTKGTSFSHFSKTYTEGAIKQYLRDKEGVLVRTPRKNTDEITTLPSKVKRFNKAHKTSVHVDEEGMANLRGYSSEEYREMSQSTHRSSIGSLDAFENFEVSYDAPNYLEEAEYRQQMSNAVQWHLSQLGHTGRLIQEHYHPDFDLSISAIASRHKLKPTEVEQRIKAGLQQIREAIA